MISLITAFILGIGVQFLGVDLLSWTHIDVVIYSLLGIGLYGAVYDIETKRIKENKTLVLLAVTIGVIFKACFIGGIMYLFFPSPYSFLLGIVVAQIDPLSVAHLKNSRSLSKEGETVLRMWSSFDDPMTVLLVMYIGVQYLGGLETTTGMENYFTQILYNFALFVVIYLIYFATIFQKNKIYEVILLIVAFFIGVKFVLMLAIASLGLYLRPDMGKSLEKAVSIAFILSVLFLGNALELSWIQAKQGILLGILAYISQIPCALLLTRKMKTRDRWGLSLAQFNGITSIILAIFLELTISGTVGIIVFAIITINSLYYFSHKLFQKHLK